MAVTGPSAVGVVDANSNQSNGSRNSDEMLHGGAEQPQPPSTTGSAEKKTPGERRRKRKNQEALGVEGARGVLDGGVKPQAAKKINEYFPRNAPGSPGAQAQGIPYPRSLALARIWLFRLMGLACTV